MQYTRATLTTVTGGSSLHLINQVQSFSPGMVHKDNLRFYLSYHLVMPGILCNT